MAVVILAFPCVCCGYLTLGESPGSHEICLVCFWEVDRVQLRWPNWAGGANRPSMLEAQANFMALTACEKRLVTKVRPPQEVEPLDPNWRPIDPERVAQNLLQDFLCRRLPLTQPSNKIVD
ncbi:CPCC family cysteine-rich protein [Streptomyces sp. NPDC005727]|uniref:CPCC family cysteine-rich protein n=1 Tax=Streptomyces sp. NPDC005727 TaxID=3157053 RepID=UPI0033DA633A